MTADAIDTLGYSAWRIALLPAFALLGVALPLNFLAVLEAYLFSLRPSELLPTFATAWLLFAAMALPFCVAAWLALLAFQRRRRVWRLMAALLLGVSLLINASTLLFCGLVWLRGFGLLREAHLAVPSWAIAMALALWCTWSARGMRIARMLVSVATPVALLGACTLVSLPFFTWDTAIPGARADFGTAQSVGARARPHILLVTMDALSAERMSLYGAARETTPSLDAFAGGATTFDRMYANSNFTTAAADSILTGTRPWSHRAFKVQDWPILQTRQESLPALLSRFGYQTGYVATNPYAGAARNGFGGYFKFHRSDAVPMFHLCPDRINAILRYECEASQLPGLMLIQRSWIKLQESLLFASDNLHYDPTQAIGSALAWLATVDKQEPVFLWLHLMPPHAPYAAPGPWLGRFSASPLARRSDDSEPEEINYTFSRTAPERVAALQARYDESIQYVDHYVGDFLDQALQRLGPNTVVVVSADHGESFMHGYGGHAGPALFDSIIHIPLIVKFPYQTQALRVPQLTEEVDLAPTLAELAGITPPPSWEGRSFASLSGATASQTLSSKPVFSMSFEENPRYAALASGTVAVLQDNWKLVHYMGTLHYPMMPNVHDELYDIAADPGETRNRIEDQRQRAADLQHLIAAELERHGGPQF